MLLYVKKFCFFLVIQIPDINPKSQSKIQRVPDNPVCNLHKYRLRRKLKDQFSGENWWEGKCFWWDATATKRGFFTTKNGKVQVYETGSNEK